MVTEQENGFCRSMEWMLVAIVCGCTLWLTCLACGYAPHHGG